MIALPLMILAIENDDDRTFITQIYLKYRKLMYAISINIVREPQTAEDMVASAITEMIEEIDMLRKIQNLALLILGSISMYRPNGKAIIIQHIFQTAL